MSIDHGKPRLNSACSAPTQRRAAALKTVSRVAVHLLGSGGILALVLALPIRADVAAGPAEERTRGAMTMIDALDDRYHAVIALDPAAPEEARRLDLQRRARGLLHGIPILLKDNIETVRLPTTAGSLALEGNVAGRDADLVAALRREGAVILGKTNLSEWANFRSEHSSSGWSAVGGQTRNAVDTSRSPCGSSSGSAVAVAVGYVDVAIGTETSGSIVCPASVNGVVGFKPTHGLVSGAGIVPLARTQDTAGPIAVDVELAARTLAAIVDPAAEGAQRIRAGLLRLADPVGLSGLRIGVFANTQNYDPRRDAELERALGLLRSAGAVLLRGLRIDPYEGFANDSYDVLLWEFRRDINGYFATLPNALSNMTLEALIAWNRSHAEQELRYFDQSIFLRAETIEDSPEEYHRKRVATRRAMRDDGLDALFENHELDALMGITVGPAWKIDWVNGDTPLGKSMARQAAIAGNPHITLPLGDVEGLPLGISLVGERWEDDRLATIARLLEDAHEAHAIGQGDH